MATKPNASRPSIAEESLQLLRGLAEVIATNPSTGKGPFPDKITSFRFKLEVTSVGSVELEVNCEPKAEARDGLDSGERALTRALPCTPADPTAARILKTCDDEWPSTQDDCNKFVKAASEPYFGEIFDGLNADDIIDYLTDSANGWSSTKSISTAITNAQAGQFVIAGMKSTEVGSQHGHVAVVVACPGQLSGTVIVPIGYAGSLGNASARIRGERLSGTFKAKDVRDEKVSYFSQAPTV